jgi:hypothetical protein
MDFKLENRIYYSANSEEKVEVLFIMESPFVDELNSFKPCPCMGYSGDVMSRALNLGDQSFGEVLAEDAGRKYAVYETFNFALDTRVCAKLKGFYSPENVYKFWDSHDIPWCGLKIQDMLTGAKLYKESLDSHKGYDRKKHYESLWDFISCIDEKVKTNFFYNYQSVLNPVLAKELFPNLKEIVVCGYIAQSVFLKAFEIEFLPFRKRSNIDGFAGTIVFVEHPGSVRGGNEWSYPDNIK